MQEILKIQNITIAIAGKVPQVCSSINSINKEISNAKAFSASRHKVPVYSLEKDISKSKRESLKVLHREKPRVFAIKNI